MAPADRDLPRFGPEGSRFDPEGSRLDPDEFVEAVLTLVERIPAGRVMSYGAIAEVVGRGGPRQVGAVMARHGGGVPWHRVVTTGGRVVPGNQREALRRLRAEGTPMRGDTVEMRTARWHP